jgi:V8-like Glu-specific endopeptidase
MIKKLILALLCLLNYANAGTIDPNVSDSKYLDYGQQHECVFRITGYERGGKHFFASCVLIRPRVIITAAHVASNVERSYVIIDDKTNIEIISLVYPEQYKENEFNGMGYDIAVGLLGAEINIKEYPQLYTDGDELEKTCSISGFGMTGNFDTGITISDGRKRAGSNTIEKIDTYETLICSANNSKKTHLEFLIAGGDSGGGLFIEKKLAGVNSSIFTYSTTPAKGDRNTYSAHTRVSKHYNWLNKVIEDIEHANSSRITRVNGK